MNAIEQYQVDNVKRLLLTEDTSTQLLGVQLALSVLGWKLYDVSKFIVDHYTKNDLIVDFTFADTDIKITTFYRRKSKHRYGTVRLAFRVYCDGKVIRTKCFPGNKKVKKKHLSDIYRHAINSLKRKLKITLQ